MLLGSRTPRERAQPPQPSGAALTGGARVDVCLVGAGLSELVAAYYLAREKRSVLVLHEGPLGGTHAGTELSHLATALPQPYDELERAHGADNARLAAQSYAAALEALEGIVRHERIACDFERLDGYRLCASHEEAEREVAAARRAGALSVQVAADPPAVRYSGQVHFHPVKLLEGLAKAIAREGGRIHGGVSARVAEPGRPAALVTSAGHRIEAGLVIAPAGRPAAAAPAQGLGLRMTRGALARALYWSTGPKLRSARLRGGSAPEILLVAGDDPPEALEAWARARFPMAKEVVQRFQGEPPLATDLFAMTGLEGLETEQVHVSTASWGSAVTRAIVAGMSIRDFAVGARVPDIEPGTPTAHRAAELEV